MRLSCCSHINNINLNYLLIMAPMSVIDYVIVHELAHIKHKHHQSEFWQLVESILSNYHQAKN
ncbi:M48 family metallopeptidase [Abyssogena phaseoliformis symbiont]|uniref:M48 metallopeptidase family protein n=1 Tax=Abyssogena phaseoliformis symbiont TaxID=596095 RepID=UPI0019161843|nr:M48 family metallopeptidase [Abyssogena phaseoliformis symbiont]